MFSPYAFLTVLRFLILLVNVYVYIRNERFGTDPLPNDMSDGNPFVLTSAVKKSFEMMLLAVNQKWPVLLYGPTGSGKSALISKLSQDSGNQGIWKFIKFIILFHIKLIKCSKSSKMKFI